MLTIKLSQFVADRHTEHNKALTPHPKRGHIWPMDRPRTMVLIVDDDQYTLRFLPRDCQRFGCHVETATSAQAAFDCLAMRTVDCIVIDVKLIGDLDAMLRDGRGKGRISDRTPLIVAMTTRVVDIDECGKMRNVGERLLTSGAASLFLPKPITRDGLAQVLCQVRELIAE